MFHDILMIPPTLPMSHPDRVAVLDSLHHLKAEAHHISLLQNHLSLELLEELAPRASLHHHVEDGVVLVHIKPKRHSKEVQYRGSILKSSPPEQRSITMNRTVSSS